MIDRWKRLAPLAGIVFVGLTVAGIVVSGNTPSSGSSGVKVLAWYKSHHGATVAQVVLFGYAALFAVVYFASVASYLRSRGADVTATVIISGGVLMAAGLGLAAGTEAALGDKTGSLSAGAAQALNQIQEDLFFITLFGGLALATLAMAGAMLRTKALPKALGIVTLIVGIGALSAIGSWFAFMASGPLTIVIAVYVYQRLGQPMSVTMPDVPSQRAEDAAMPETEQEAEQVELS